MTTGAANRAIFATLETEVEPQIQSALNKVHEGREEIIGIVHAVKEILSNFTASDPIESDELDLIESLQQEKAALTPDSIKWIYYEVTGQRMSGDALQQYEPDDPSTFDRAAFRRFVAEGVEGVKAVHRAYQFVLLRTADPSGLEYHREQLATGALTYWTLIEKLLRGSEHQQRFSSPSQPRPATPPHPHSPTPILRGNFIRRAGHESTHYLMSDLISDNDRRAVVERELAEGANAISLMPWFESDYHGAHFPVNFQRGDEIFWLPELMRMTERGLTPIIWMMTDDAMPHLNRTDLNEVWIATREEMLENSMSHSGFVDQAQRWFKLQTGRIGAVQPLSEAYVLEYWFAGRIDALPVITFDEWNPTESDPDDFVRTGEEIHISGTIEDQNEDIIGWNMTVATASGRKLIHEESGLSVGAVQFSVPHTFLKPGWAYFEVTATDFENQQIGWSTARWPAYTTIEVTGDAIDAGTIRGDLDWAKGEHDKHWKDLTDATNELANKLDLKNQALLDQLEIIDGFAQLVREDVDSIIENGASKAWAELQLATVAADAKKELGSAVTQLTQSISTLQESFAEDINALLSRIRDAESGNQQTASAVSALRTEVTENYAKSSDLKKLKTDLGTLDGTVQGQSQILNSFNTRIGTAEGKINTQATKVEELESWVGPNKAKVQLLADTFIKNGTVSAGMKMNVDANGVFAGWEAYATTDDAGRGSSEMTFNADRFYFIIGGRKYKAGQGSVRR